MKLYYRPGTCSLSPHIVALEAGIALEFETIDFATHKTESGGDFYAINPKGYVPTLVLDDGTVLTEGAVIVQYLADQKPESGLAPANGTLARYKLQEWLAFINSEIHRSFTPLFMGATGDVKAQSLEKIARRFAYVEKELGHKPYIMGDTFTAADAYFFVMLTWAQHLKIALSPALTAYFGRVAARPKVHEAMKAEGLVQ